MAKWQRVGMKYRILQTRTKIKHSLYKKTETGGIFKKDSPPVFIIPLLDLYVFVLAVVAVTLIQGFDTCIEF